MNKEVNLVIKKEVVQRLVSYLSSKPYHEVYQMIPMLQTAESVDSHVLKNRDSYKQMLHSEAEQGD